MVTNNNLLLRKYKESDVNKVYFYFLWMLNLFKVSFYCIEIFSLRFRSAYIEISFQPTEILISLSAPLLLWEDILICYSNAN